jgi:hypothetical protein
MRISDAEFVTVEYGTVGTIYARPLKNINPQRVKQGRVPYHAGYIVMYGTYIPYTYIWGRKGGPPPPKK